jgi:hypothetical protein
MYEKYLRNVELVNVEAMYRKSRTKIAPRRKCGKLRYPVRPTGQYQFACVGGFKQHPNESQDM